MKTTLTKIIISALLISLVAGMHAVEVAKANPFSFFWTHIDPIPGTIPPTITLTSPQNNTHHASKHISFSFNISKPQVPVPVDDGISAVRYSIDNFNFTGAMSLYQHAVYAPGHMGLPEFSYSEDLTLPEGNHSLTVYSEGTVTQPDIMTVFGIGSYSTVYFTIDTTPPTISDLSIEPKTYDTADIPLSLYVNEISHISYSIDNQANVTIAGNTTLTALSEGYHNIIIYANDTAGNIGRSDYVVFDVNSQPSPTPNNIQGVFIPTVIIFGLVFAVAIGGLLVYFKKPRRDETL